MGIIDKVKGAWVGFSETNGPKSKGFDDTLIGIRNGNYEEMSKAGVTNPYAQNYVIKRSIDLIAQNIAQVPLDVYGGEIKMPIGWDFNQVLRRPNSYTSTFELWESTVSYLFLHGESFWYLNTNEYGFVKEIFVLHPKFMKHYQEDTMSPVSRWVYNDKVPMDIKNVVQFKLFNTSGVRGLSPLDAVTNEYQADAEASHFNKKFFINNTRMGGVISVDKDVQVTLDEMKRVLAEWKSAHKGAENSYKVGVLLNGMKYEELGQTMRDMEFIEGRSAVRDRILMLYGIPKSIVGVTEKIDRSTFDVALRSVWQLTLKPNLVRIQQKLNAELFDEFYPGHHCKFDLSVVEELKKDLVTTLEAADMMFKLGYTRDEINLRLGLGMPEKTENGEQRYLPMQMVPDDMNPLILTQEGKAVETVIEKVANAPFDKVQSTQEKLLYTKIKNFLFIQRGKVLKVMVKDKMEGSEYADLISKLNTVYEGEGQRLETAVTPYYMAAATAGVGLAYAQLGITNEAVASEALIYERLNMIKGANVTIFNQVKKELFAGFKAGETLDQLAERVKGVYGHLEKNKALQIARTETTAIINYSLLKTFKEKGVSSSRWVTRGDELVRDKHLNNSNKIRPVGDKFPSGEQYPGQSSVNCRCTIYVVK